MHFNLKLELTQNERCPLSNIEFDEELLEAKQQRNEFEHNENWKASETNEAYGIKFGDCIGIEHVLCIRLYCNRSYLCKEFRRSYRPISNNDTNATITKRHINNFYWMGRYSCIFLLFIFIYHYYHNKYKNFNL